MRHLLPEAGRCVRWLALMLIGMLSQGLVVAHEMSIAEIELHEMSKGQFVWGWGQSASTRPLSADLTPVWPEGCTAEEQSLHCPPAGLVGRLSVEGVGKRYSAAMVRITWLDGQSRVYTITPAQPAVYLYGAVDDGRSARDIVIAYTVLGIEHILTGVDHLLFVIGLLFLVGFRRRLVGTITAFTVAHSLTLASSVLGFVTLRSAPVEASIALSIVLVAAEALRERETLAKRLPALVAFLFGLVHGLGFAGALKEIGLPDKHLWVALLTFNVGVEIGQLMTVAACFLVTRIAIRHPAFGRGRAPALYAIGIIAAYWSWSRIAGIVA
ncbi:MAG: HupE/UreJ family protein [Betaproteobacteria bacterium]|nr:HupE/UreJ family protein [Betaproteobacteria bacterium]